ncbi:MAG: glycosyltransferase [Candidatus Lindowbacteria bacterium]|nr:glycosyltransferase [Candidatus Lindowbacteria bacterium]
MSVFAFRALRKYARRLKALGLEELISDEGAPPVSLIAPAYNMAATCVEATQSLLTLQYPEYEILFINDGSTDDTMKLMAERYSLIPAARVPTTDIPT